MPAVPSAHQDTQAVPVRRSYTCVWTECFKSSSIVVVHLMEDVAAIVDVSIKHHSQYFLIGLIVHLNVTYSAHVLVSIFSKNKNLHQSINHRFYDDDGHHQPRSGTRELLTLTATTSSASRFCIPSRLHPTSHSMNQPKKAQQEAFACPNCGTLRQALRFAPHLEKCMGGGRDSRRTAALRANAAMTSSTSTSSRMHERPHSTEPSSHNTLHASELQHQDSHVSDHHNSKQQSVCGVFIRITSVDGPQASVLPMLVLDDDDTASETKYV